MAGWAVVLGLPLKAVSVFLVEAVPDGTATWLVDLGNPSCSRHQCSRKENPSWPLSVHALAGFGKAYVPFRSSRPWDSGLDGPAAPMVAWQLSDLGKVLEPERALLGEDAQA